MFWSRTCYTFIGLSSKFRQYMYYSRFKWLWKWCWKCFGGVDKRLPGGECVCVCVRVCGCGCVWCGLDWGRVVQGSLSTGYTGSTSLLSVQRYRCGCTSYWHSYYKGILLYTHTVVVVVWWRFVYILATSQSQIKMGPTSDSAHSWQFDTSSKTQYIAQSDYPDSE